MIPTWRKAWTRLLKVFSCRISAPLAVQRRESRSRQECQAWVPDRRLVPSVGGGCVCVCKPLSAVAVECVCVRERDLGLAAPHPPHAGLRNNYRRVAPTRTAGSAAEIHWRVRLGKKRSERKRSGGADRPEGPSEQELGWTGLPPWTCVTGDQASSPSLGRSPPRAGPGSGCPPPFPTAPQPRRSVARGRRALPPSGNGEDPAQKSSPGPPVWRTDQERLDYRRGPPSCLPCRGAESLEEAARRREGAELSFAPLSLRAPSRLSALPEDARSSGRARAGGTLLCLPREGDRDPESI